jgi:geranylgeranyl pyrophosphate synthase
MRYLPAPPGCPPLLHDAMRYSVFAGGKRLRPILAMAAADAVERSSRVLGVPGSSPALSPNVRAGLSPDAIAALSPAVALALPAACAVELIHTYSLIHDDLPAMDDDTLRRGRPTLHVVYGDGMAILAGDALQAAAFALLAREPIGDDPDIATRKLRVLQTIAGAAGAAGMVGGQAIDLQAAGQVQGHAITLDAEGLQAMHQRKTGALICASAVSGAVMAGAADDVVRAVDRWAAQVGLAFQIVDDILDVEGDAGELGKTAGKDAARGKPTYPSLFGLERSRALVAECADRARATLHEAALTEGWLADIAAWVVTRRS